MTIRNTLICLSFLGLTGLIPPVVQAAECVDTSPAEAEAAIQDARRAVLTLEYGPTLAKLEEVRKSLPCLTGTLPADTIATLYFFQGLLQVSQDQLEPGLNSFRDAAAVSPLLQEDREHDSKVREKWAAARDEITRLTGTLVIPGLPKETTAYVNGKPLQAGTQSVTVYPGAHLVQIQGDDRRLHGTLMRVRPGETSLVPAEFLASLTPRGELVFDIMPRRSHVVVRQGEEVLYDMKKMPRRKVLGDVKQGAYIVEVSRMGYFPFSRGKVAVEGGDQTQLEVRLERRPSMSLIPRYGMFWISAEPRGSNLLGSLELVGRTSSGWGLHFEYLYHVTPTGGTSFTQPEPYTTNPDHELEDDGDYVNGPPAYPNVTTAGLPVGSTLYLGVTRRFIVEGFDVAVGPKLSMDLYRGSLLGEVSLGYDFVPWVGINLRAGLGGMVHVSDYIRNKMEDDPLTDYLQFGMVGMVDAGLRFGF